MKVWPSDPSDALLEVFSAIGRERMAGLPICNDKLKVEAIGFQRWDDGHWLGIMILPWAINLLRLPGGDDWPELAAGDRHDWRFPSGTYEFLVAEEARLGNYQLCSLFSPALEFASHEAARETAHAALQALLAAPSAPAAPSRRSFLRLPG